MSFSSEISNTRVLVIDDDPLFRNLVLSLLRKEYFVSVAKNGAEGFDKAKKYPPDVAIIDVQMPEWDGLQTLKAFRSHPTLSNTIIIMLTSDASKGTVLAAIKEGANDYIIKQSFTKAELQGKVQKFVESRSEKLSYTSNSARRQEVTKVSNSAQMSKNPAEEFFNSESYEDLINELALDQSEDEQLNELINNWD